LEDDEEQPQQEAGGGKANVAEDDRVRESARVRRGPVGVPPFPTMWRRGPCR
jgi:hypothetical protein